MNAEVDVIWHRGDVEMPEKVKYIVNAAKDELLLRSLQLPIDIVNRGNRCLMSIMRNKHFCK